MTEMNDWSKEHGFNCSKGNHFWTDRQFYNLDDKYCVACRITFGEYKSLLEQALDPKTDR